MTKFEEYLERYATVLAHTFEATRLTLTDSTVKGGENERIVAEFLENHLSVRQVRRNVQVVDSADRCCDEIDVCLCNEYRAFGSNVALLIAEGVDAVVQVKARLNGHELTRAFKNCGRLKALRRKCGKGDYVVCPTGMPDETLNQIPYVIFAFQQELAQDTLLERLKSREGDVGPDQMPDAVFSLDRGISYVNCREGIDWPHVGSALTGWVAEASEGLTLLRFLLFLNTRFPRFLRVNMPLVEYFPPPVMNECKD